MSSMNGQKFDLTESVATRDGGVVKSARIAGSETRIEANSGDLAAYGAMEAAIRQQFYRNGNAVTECTNISENKVARVVSPDHLTAREAIVDVSKKNGLDVNNAECHRYKVQAPKP